MVFVPSVIKDGTGSSVPLIVSYYVCFPHFWGYLAITPSRSVKSKKFKVVESPPTLTTGFWIAVGLRSLRVVQSKSNATETWPHSPDIVPIGLPYLKIVVSWVIA